jgi:hypothetical protein
MSGFYNYWPKVNHPNEVFSQTESSGFQAPFFFGGSQVPTALGIKGNGIRHTLHHVSTHQPIVRLGHKVQSTYHEKHKNIHIPRRLKAIHLH